ncbi:transcriptional regulator [Corynebacterium pseudopelargi]|uniref:Bacterial regulatory protein, arsR family n=1 Tax=Corynebacterium pseudopelargi TaxID=2080757 RepID=A0A3G6IY63_9CORY|nr:transcriptional regulator [Corynebacterium pseudopelargi]AZA09598.1 Bacterial regulatory protein, arsR family [Corynebacterium pseudopelargi]
MAQLDPLIHPIQRLAICATLYGAGAVEGLNEMRFSKLAEATALSPSALSKHLRALEEAGYLSKFREIGSTRADDVLWLQLSHAGRDAYKEHMAALEGLEKEQHPQNQSVRVQQKRG